MKRTTIWKIAASVLLIAMLVPLFPAMAPHQANAITVKAPLPYALENYGQLHNGIYRTNTAPTLDGELDADKYTFVNSFNDQSRNTSGIFASTKADGSDSFDPASEFKADEMTIYGAYDDTNVYFYVKTVSREYENGYALTAAFGFNFGQTQKNAQETRKAYSFSIGAGEGVKTDNSTYCITESVADKASSDSSGDHYLATVVYEFCAPWSEFAPEGQNVGVNFDRMYTSFTMRYFDKTTERYWVYGVPNATSYLSSQKVSIGTAFGAGAGTFTPNIIEFLGTKSAFTQAPKIAKVKRTDTNTDLSRAFLATLSVSDVKSADIKEAGILLLRDASTLAGSRLTLNNTAAEKITASSFTGENILNADLAFQIPAADYEKFFTVRPYVIYKDDSNTTIYGTSYTNAAQYIDSEATEYEETLNLLMIGNSFNTRYLDEIVGLAKADKIYLTAVRSYYSGAQAFQHWVWLVDDYDSVVTRRVRYPKDNGTIADEFSSGTISLKEVMAYTDWDVICAQSHDGTDGFYIENRESCITDVMEYMPNFYRYLEANFPEADLYYNQHWSFQVGWERGEHKMDSTEKQQIQYETIKAASYALHDSCGIPLIPSGDAWQLARANPLIGDTLCDLVGGGDSYHDGDIGGGQYLNGCVWYETITGNSCIGNTWRPYEYDLSEEKIAALQQAAHEAVLAVYGPDHYNK